MIEIEVKAQVVNKDLLLSKLIKLGILFTNPIEQFDTVYIPKSVKWEDRVSSTPILRIRKQDSKAIFTLKIGRSEGNDLDKIEHETEVADPEELEEIIKIIGYYEVVKLSKKRSKAKYLNYEICIDQVKDLGDFIELEYLGKDSNLNALDIQKEMYKFLDSVGINNSDIVFKGYDILIRDKLKLT